MSARPAQRASVLMYGASVVGIFRMGDIAVPIPAPEPVEADE